MKTWKFNTNNIVTLKLLFKMYCATSLKKCLILLNFLYFIWEHLKLTVLMGSVPNSLQFVDSLLASWNIALQLSPVGGV